MQIIKPNRNFDINDPKNYEIILQGSSRDLEQRAELDASTSPSPLLPNNVEKLSVQCPVCNIECLSTHCSSTLVGYMSPKGHDHDDNCRKFDFTCSNNHHFKIRAQNTCPACDWKGSPVCYTCGDNVKVYE